MNKIIQISIILSFCILNQSFAMEQQDHEDHNQLQATQENNTNFVNNNTDSLQEITLNKIINNTPAQNLLKQILAGKLNDTDTREILRKKILQKYKFNLINLFKLNKHSIILLDHTNTVSSVAFSPCGRFALTGSYDKTTRLWNLTDLNKIKSIILQGHTDWVTSVTFSPCGKFALTGSWDNTVRLWNLGNLNNITSRILQDHTGRVNSVAFSPCGRFALTGSENTAILWDLQNYNSIYKVLEIIKCISSVGFSHCSNFALTGSEDNVKLWNLRDLNNIKSIVLNGHSSIVNSVTFSPSGRFALTGSHDATTRLWDLRNLNNISSKILPQIKKTLPPFRGLLTCPINSVAFSPCNRFVLIGSWSKNAILGDLINLNKQFMSLIGHIDDITSVAFNPCGKFALTGSYDHTARLWKLEPDLTLEQLLLLAILFEYQSKKLDHIFKNSSYNNIFNSFTNKQKKQIRKHFNINNIINIHRNCIVS